MSARKFHHAIQLEARRTKGKATTPTYPKPTPPKPLPLPKSARKESDDE